MIDSTFKNKFSGKIEEYEFSSLDKYISIKNKLTGEIDVAKLGFIYFSDSTINSYIKETRVDFNNTGIEGGTFVSQLPEGRFVILSTYVELNNGSNGAIQILGQDGLPIGSKENIIVPWVELSSVTGLNSGRFVISGTDYDHNFAAQIQDASGNIISSISLSQPYSYSDSEVTALPDGGFVVAHCGGSNSNVDVYIQRYDAIGNRIGEEFRANTNVVGNQVPSGISSFADGSYVVAWRNDALGGNGVTCQRFDINGGRIGSEVIVSTEVSQSPKVSALSNGGFAVTWYGNGRMKAQSYSAENNPVGDSFTPTESNGSFRYSAENHHIASLVDGDYVVAWSSTTRDESIHQNLDTSIYTQRFDSNGIKIGSPTQVNTGILKYDLTIRPNINLSALSEGG